MIELLLPTTDVKVQDVLPDRMNISAIFAITSPAQVTGSPLMATVNVIPPALSDGLGRRSF